MRHAKASTVVLAVAVASTLLVTGGCDMGNVFRDPPPRVHGYWNHSISLDPMISMPDHTPRESRGHMINDVSVYGYDKGVTLHFSLKDHKLADLIDAAGGLPPPLRRGHKHLGVVRAKVDLPGGAGYAFSFHNIARRRAISMLAELCDHSVIVGNDVLDTIDVEVEGAPPIAVLRLLADEGGCIILEDDGN